jgi:hypothetical protein
VGNGRVPAHPTVDQPDRTAAGFCQFECGRVSMKTRTVETKIVFFMHAIYCYIIGNLIAYYFSSVLSPTTTGIICFVLWGLYIFLTIQAKTDFNDGSSTEMGAIVFGWLWAAVATGIIVGIVNAGQMFLLVATLFFVSTATIYFVFVYKNPGIAGSGSIFEILGNLLRKDQIWLEQIKQFNLKISKNKRPFEYFMGVLLNAISGSGVITATVAFIVWLLYQI